MSSASAVTVRFVTASDSEAWKRLYAGYRDFYRLASDPAVVDRVWLWLRASEHGLRGLVAEVDGVVVALANVRTFARPSSGSIGLYLDDLFTDPAARGRGAASALLDRLAQIAGAEGATVVRWITADTNTAARSVYDAHATAIPWVTYDLSPTASSSRSE